MLQGNGIIYYGTPEEQNYVSNLVEVPNEIILESINLAKIKNVGKLNAYLVWRKNWKRHRGFRRVEWYFKRFLGGELGIWKIEWELVTIK